MRRLLILLAFVLFNVSACAQGKNSNVDHANMATPEPAQDWAKQRLNKSPRHQEWVQIKSGNRTINTVIVYPEVKSKTPAVLVIHEIFGLSDWVQGLTDQVAEAGYIAIAPDLLSGMGPKGGGTSDFPDRNAVTQAVSK